MDSEGLRQGIDRRGEYGKSKRILDNVEKNIDKSAPSHAKKGKKMLLGGLKMSRGR